MGSVEGSGIRRTVRRPAAQSQAALCFTLRCWETAGGEAEMADYVLIEKADGVAILTMHRPEQLNAMNHQLMTELHDGVMHACADDEVGCIVITGAGTRAFS